MSKVEKCKQIMLDFFGPASAKVVEYMGNSDEEIVKACKQKVTALLGAEKAKVFDNI